MEIPILLRVDDQTRNFKMFLKSLIAKFQPSQIFCFSRNAVLRDSTGCFVEQTLKESCHYCLLMVTVANEKIDHQVQEFANKRFKGGSVTILCHGEQTVLNAMQSNNRFFISTCTPGRMLYSKKGGVQHCSNNHIMSQDHIAETSGQLSSRLSLAEGFLRGAKHCLNHDQFTVCSFLLHQVVEQCCIALIRVHMAYRCEVHNLQRMLNLCRCFSDKPVELFLSGTSDDQRVFDILVKSYSKSRYGDPFIVSGEDASNIHLKARKFVALTKRMCNKKIAAMNNDSALCG